MSELERLIQAADARAANAAAGVQAAIDALARANFARLWQYLIDHPGESPRDAILALQVEFSGAFAEALAQAFSALLLRSVGVGEVRAMPVGDISLSRRLYLHAVQTAAEVRTLVQQHAAGVHQARSLAIRLYDGYSPRDGLVRPLEGRARAALPKALRQLTDDLHARRTLTGVLLEGQKRAGRLKSEALKAAYLETFDAWQRGDGRDALKRRLDIAQREKNRFFADRIAQTELHRAHQSQVASDLMDDGSTTVVQVRLNPSHPRRDICDLHARADLYGLGPGCYPKERAPVAPYHPFCRCRLRPRPSLTAAPGLLPRPNAEAQYLRELGDDAAAVMGSAERAARVMRGEPAEAVINAGKVRAYRLQRVGDVPRHALLKDAETA